MRNAIFMVMLLAPLSAQSAGVYQCPTANGTVSFTDRPCAGGTEVHIAPSNSVSSNPGPSSGSTVRESTDEFLAKRKARANRVKSRYAAKLRGIQEERRHRETVNAIKSIGSGGYSRLTGHKIYTWR